MHPVPVSYTHLDVYKRQGISYTYAMETLKETGMVRHLKVSTPHPFPEKLAVEFLTGLDEVLCLEELDPVIERELIYICRKYHLNTKIIGKLSGCLLYTSPLPLLLPHNVS